MMCYLNSLVRVWQQGYHHVNKQNDSHDKKDSKKKTCEGHWSAVHWVQRIQLCYSQQRPREMLNHAPPTVRTTTTTSKLVHIVICFWYIFYFGLILIITYHNFEQKKDSAELRPSYCQNWTSLVIREFVSSKDWLTKPIHQTSCKLCNENIQYSKAWHPLGT